MLNSIIVLDEKSGMEHKGLSLKEIVFKISLIDKANLYHMCTIGQQVKREKMVLGIIT